MKIIINYVIKEIREKNRILFKSNFVRSISSYHFFFFFGFLLLYMMNGFCDGVVCPLVAVCKKCF